MFGKCLTTRCTGQTSNRCGFASQCIASAGKLKAVRPQNPGSTAPQTQAQNMSMNATWPNDADGDVFRRLEANGFDFSHEYEIDFNVDFGNWPPHPDALTWLKSKYSNVAIYEPEEDFSGYMQFKIWSKLTYSLVIDTQADATAGTRRYGGICESWGVMQPAP